MPSMEPCYHATNATGAHAIRQVLATDNDGGWWLVTIPLDDCAAYGRSATWRDWLLAMLMGRV